MYGWMEGWIDGWIDSVGSRYSFCGKSDGWMDGKCKFGIVFFGKFKIQINLNSRALIDGWVTCYY